MMFSNDDPRTWKWAVPAAIFILLIPITGKMFASLNPETQFWSSVPCGFEVLCLAVAGVNAWKLISAHKAKLFTEHQEALSVTPLVLLAQSMKQMHPEAVRVLNRFGVRTSWQVRVDQNHGTRDWVLADTNVHFGFIEYVLSHSGVGLYPKRFFSEGSKKWDPDGLVEDRQQYDELENWMLSRLMVTRSHGEFKPAEWIPPWTPALILEVMGLTGEQDLYKPEDGRVKDLATAIGDQRSAISGNGHKGNGNERDEPGLTEAELEAIAAINAAHAEQYSS
jgi:hypothetical protein